MTESAYVLANWIQLAAQRGVTAVADVVGSTPEERMYGVDTALEYSLGLLATW